VTFSDDSKALLVRVRDALCAWDVASPGELAAVKAMLYPLERIAGKEEMVSLAGMSIDWPRLD
jgi:hypothetical protein